MSVESVDDIAIGDTIRFKTLSAHDNVVWTGDVASICNYDTAKVFYDIDAYYATIKRTVTSLTSKESLTYLVIKITQSDNSTAYIAVAKEWIDESTLEKVTSNTHTDIRIYNIDASKAKDILSYIKTAYPGYNAEILS